MVRGLVELQPAGQLAMDDVLDHADPLETVVEARDGSEFLAAGLPKIASVFNADLLDRLEAVSRKARRDDGDALDAPLGKRPHRLIGIGLKIFGRAETRLEGHLKSFP